MLTWCIALFFFIYNQHNYYYYYYYGFKIYADLQGYRCPSELFQLFRPDVVVIKKDTIYVIELTCCFETNTEKSRNYKMGKCNQIERDCLLTFRHFKKIFVRITTLGHITEYIKQLKRLFNGTEINCRYKNVREVHGSVHARFLLFVYTTQQIVDQSRFVEILLTFKPCQIVSVGLPYEFRKR